MNLISFDGWTVNPTSGELTRGGITVRLQDQGLQVLLTLLAKPGQVVTRDELIARLWPEVVVDYDTSLKSIVRKLRVTLTDDADQPRYIETLPRKGYRFIGNIKSADSPADEVTAQPKPPAPTRLSRSAPLVILAVLAMLAFVAIAIVAMRSPEPTPVRLGVLPFENLSPDPANSYFADGLHEELLTTLANRATAMDVISRTTMMNYRPDPKTVREIAQELGVTHVLEGSVRRDGTTVRVTLQLIDARKDDHVWSQTYDRQLGNAMTLQSDLAREVVAQLAHKLSSDVVTLPSSNAEAYDLYLRAMVAGNSLNQRSLLDDFTRVEHWLDRAIELDSNYAGAYALRAQLRMLKYVLNHDLSDTNRELARQDVEAAERFARNSAMVVLARARYLGLFEVGPQKAIEPLEAPAIAASKEPNLLKWRAFYLCRAERFGEGLAVYRKAAALDPGNASIFTAWRRELWGLRQPEDALRVVQSYNEHGPGRIPTGDLEFAFTGNTLPLRKEIIASSVTGGDIQLLEMFDLLRYERRFVELNELVTRTKFDVLRVGGYREFGGPGIGNKPIAEMRGWANLLLGDTEAAARDAKDVVAFVKDQPVTSQNAAHLRMLTAEATLFSGNHAQAITETRRAMQLNSQRFTYSNRYSLLLAARTYAWAGADDEAVTILEELATKPPAHGPAEITRDPLFSIALKNNARYQVLAKKLEAEIASNQKLFGGSQ